MRAPFKFRTLFRILGTLLIIEAIFLTIALLVSLLYGEDDWKAFLITVGIAAGAGAIIRFATRTIKPNVSKREGYVVVSSVWVLFSAIGALPFVIHGGIPSYTDAFFETISGFTTTGSSILNDIESLPHGLLFWRSIIQWMGGMGIIVMSLVILPILGIGGMQLFAAEAPGPVADKLHPRVKETAKRLWAIYVLFTFTEFILLLFGGMSVFDAINHAFTTMATGGYSTKQASIAHWDSAYIQYVITFFMFLAGVNFSISYWALKLDFKKVLRNEEFRAYFTITLTVTSLVTGVLYFTSDLNFEKAFRDSVFQVVTILTTTGYATADYLTWTPFLWILMFILIFLGGSTGSTAGGIKTMRIMIVVKNSFAEFKRLVHPNAIIPVRFDGKPVHASIVHNILAFVVIFILIFVLGTLVLAAIGLDLETAMGASITALANVGPGIGQVGPASNFAALPDAAKWVLSFLMLIGRLELFTVLILFSPAFWHK